MDKYIVAIPLSGTEDHYREIECKEAEHAAELVRILLKCSDYSVRKLMIFVRREVKEVS
jgi:hypothetical protein